MKIPALTVHPDEPCYGLYDGPRKGRWIQAVYVIRADAIAEWVKDYGPEANFKGAQPLLMPSYGENKVAQLQEWAEKNRTDTYWDNRAREMKSESTLIADVLRQDEEKKLQIRNKTVIGPYRTVERNFHSQDIAKRELKQRRTDDGSRVY